VQTATSETSCAELAGQALIGVDVGGTHTDVCVSSPQGIVRGKALTTHDDYSQGVIEAIGVAAERLGHSAESLLAETQALVNGTTVVTNALTELRGAKVGVLVTRGFRDTFRFAGGARKNVYDDQLQVNPPDITPRSCIKEIDERIVSDGSALLPLNEEQVRQAVRDLRDDEGVETLAVCFLWSFLNPVHERRTAEIIAEEWPGVFVTISSDVYPVMREHERFFSCVFNSFCQPGAVRLLETLDNRLRENKFQGNLSFFAGAGGAITRELAERFPLLLLGSGPAGGVTGAIALGKLMGISDIMVGDMGGTSFDTALIRGSEPELTSQVDVGGMPTGVTVLDILSVGAGGGSIASVDERGVPIVGPHSAGSMPGPACYGRGGTQATVTDAAVAGGIMDPGGYLDGRLTLDREASMQAVGRFGETFGWQLEAAVDAILQLSITNMAGALRSVTIERGQDPRDCTMFAYGGTLPMFAAGICERLGVKSVVVPMNSSVFSALGLLLAKFVRRYSRSVDLSLGDSAVPDIVAKTREEMTRVASEEAIAGGIKPGDCILQWGGELKFVGQTFEISVPLPSRPLTAEDVQELAETFPGLYEKAYGKGTAWEGSPVMMLNLSLTVVADRPMPEIVAASVGTADSSGAERARRRVLMPGGSWAEDVPIYDGSRFSSGMIAEGPAIVDEHDTTLFVPPGWQCRRDEWTNYRLERAES
jgi:N-methylhydantoinase A